MSLHWARVLCVCSLIGFIQLINAKKDGITFGIVPNPPFLMLPLEEGGNYTGYIPDVLDQISQILDINITIKEASGYGSSDEQGKWSGLIGELMNKTIDAAGPLIVSSRRDAVVKFTVPLISSGHAILMKKPMVQVRTVTDDLTRLLQPLEFPVWLMSVLAFLVTSTILYIIAHFNPYEWRRMAKDKMATMREAETFTCVNSFWFVISTMAWQGYVRAPRSIGGRITVTAWWFFVLIFILSYTASLTNYLRDARSPYIGIQDYPRIHSLEDLVANDDVKVVTVTDGSTENRFKYYAEHIDSKVYDKIKASKDEFSINSTEEALRLLRSTDNTYLALLMDSTTARYLVSRQPCTLYMVDTMLGARYDSFATDDEQLQYKLDKALLRLRESSFLSYMDKKWFDSEECSTVHPDDLQVSRPYTSMDLGRFSGALCILTFGVVLGGVVSIVEYCVYTCAESHAFKEVEQEMAAKNKMRRRREEEQRGSSEKTGAANV